MSAQTPSLVGHGLTHSFTEAGATKTILSGVDLELHPGRLTVVMGPSGSGKTTLLGILAGLMRPEAGEVEVLGCRLWALSEAQRKAFRLRHCGFIFQGHNLFPALTARQQLEIVLRWGRSVSGRQVRRQAEEMLSRLGLSPEQFNQRPLALSGGEKQRVAVGRALVKGPDLCFADEPTASLDWESGRNVAELLRDAARGGAAVLVITHDQRLRHFADRAYCLRDGRLWELPREERLTESPREDAGSTSEPGAMTLEV
jgi:putative ABC transport system ATP-binding protein